MANNLNLYKINTTHWEGGDFLITTSLTKEQVTKVLTSVMIELEESEDYDYDASYLVRRLSEAYPNSVILLSYNFNIDTISI